MPKKGKAGKAKKAPTAKQLAARAKFAAMARGAVGKVRGVAKKGGGGGRRASHGGLIPKTAKPLQMALMGAAGYLSGGLMEDLGIGEWLAAKSPGIRAAMNGSKNIRSSGVWVAKAAGAGLLAHSIYESRHGTIPSGVLNTELPFALGAILDPESSSDVGGGTSGDRWY